MRKQKGVFRSPLPLLRRVWLLALNRLEPQPHNAYVKIFASRAQERETAFATLDMPTAEEADLQSFILGLRTTMKEQGEDEMERGLTPEKIMEIGEQVRDFVLETTKPENVGETLRRRILETISPEERPAGMSAADRKELLRLLQDAEDAAAGGEVKANGDAA